MSSNSLEQPNQQQLQTYSCNVKLIVTNPQVVANFVFAIPNKQRSNIVKIVPQQQNSTNQNIKGNKYVAIQNSGEREQTQQQVQLIDFARGNKTCKQLFYEVKFNYSFKILNNIKEFQYSVKKIISTNVLGDKFSIEKLEFEGDNFPIQLFKYFEKDREFNLGSLYFRAKVVLAVFESTQGDCYIAKDFEHFSVKETEKPDEKQGQAQNNQTFGQQRDTNNVEKEVQKRNFSVEYSEHNLQNSLIKIIKGTKLQKDYQIEEKYSLEEKSFNLGKQRLFFWRQSGQLSISLELQKIIHNKIINITNISINSSAPTQSVFVYVCYQFQKKTIPKATPIGILDYKRVQTFGLNFQMSALTLRVGEKFPSIYESDEISCKHLVIFNIQFEKQNHIQVYPNIDIIFPIVLLQESILKNHEYVTKNYFTYCISEELVNFRINQNDSVSPEYCQLLPVN